MATVNYKFPLTFIQQHRQLLETWDWSQGEMRLGDHLPDIPELSGVVLECAMGHLRRGRGLVVRCKDGPSMVAVRKYSETLESA